jgi:transposase
VADPLSRPLTPRRATWLVLRRPDMQDDHERAQWLQLKAPQAEVAAAIAVAPDMAQRVRERQPDPLAPWLARAAESPLGPWQRLAKGRRDDDEAGKASLTWPWSNGPVEGPIHRLKTLKRQRCGRSDLDLLQRRFLLPAEGRCQHAGSASGPPPQRGVGVRAALLSARPPGRGRGAT